MLYKVSIVSICQFQSPNSPHPSQATQPPPPNLVGFLKFVYFWLHRVFVTLPGLSLVAMQEPLIAEVSLVGEYRL